MMRLSILHWIACKRENLQGLLKAITRLFKVGIRWPFFVGRVSASQTLDDRRVFYGKIATGIVLQRIVKAHDCFIKEMLLFLTRALHVGNDQHIAEIVAIHRMIFSILFLVIYFHS